MSRFLTWVLVVLMSQGFAFSQIPELVADQGYADMILVNGKIVTMDDWSIVPDTPGTIVEAMAVKGKKIMALGTNRQMRELAGPATRFVESLGTHTYFVDVLGNVVKIDTCSRPGSHSQGSTHWASYGSGTH